MDSSPSKANVQPSLPPLAGTKRPPPSLLPAFEPLSSSPGFLRPSKRQALSSPSQRHAYARYPTPIPTSTTGILSSSPPRIQLSRPGLQRTQSSGSERAPLSAVPTITLSENGAELLMGRSSNSSHYQLSANRFISRVHVKARYIPAITPLEAGKIEIVCTGWNGVKVHCHGRTWELGKDDSFTSETETAEIMLDVQDARVIVAWPTASRKASPSIHTESSWEDETSPSRRLVAVNARGQQIQSSPLRMGQRLVSPESPTPAGSHPANADLSSLFADDTEKGVVQVYEDESCEEEQRSEEEGGESQMSTQAASQAVSLGDSQSSELSEPGEDDPDEENDPIIHSFGPFGANISSRMASFTASSPEQRRSRVRRDSSSSPAKRSSSASTNPAELTPVVNHVVNQLAFSRLSSTPLSTILNHLPAELKGGSPSRAENRGLTKVDLHRLLLVTPCLGEIHREGKDAAGKALESEYYYIPEEDHDEQRRAAVVEGLRRPTLRNCRKQHKAENAMTDLGRGNREGESPMM
ncbi:MAG: hypothetical protein M1818_000479 [Claussenomyces sp. TS43310]|nr:MAG: hypothetical protein M1818_000479 [Claussenomyces sp. TS43310]